MTDAERRCRSCRAQMLFATVIKTDGARTTLPIDPTPVPAGNLEYVGGPAEKPLLRALTEEQRAEPAAGDRYQSHFRSCPQSEVWRANPKTYRGRGARARARRASRAGQPVEGPR